MRTRDDLSLASAIALINLQPGGLAIDIDNRRKTVTMHPDGSSTGRIDKTIRQLGRLEWQVIRAFETATPRGGARRCSLGHDHADVQGRCGGDAQAGPQTEAGTPTRKED